MAVRIPLPDLKREFPDLDRALAYEISRLKKGCGNCAVSDLVKKYKRLADERRRSNPPKRL